MKKKNNIKFIDWFNDSLTIDRFPMPTEIEKSDIDIYINVSD